MAAAMKGYIRSLVYYNFKQRCLQGRCCVIFGRFVVAKVFVVREDVIMAAVVVPNSEQFFFCFLGKCHYGRCYVYEISMGCYKSLCYRGMSLWRCHELVIQSLVYYNFQQRCLQGRCCVNFGRFIVAKVFVVREDVIMAAVVVPNSEQKSLFFWGDAAMAAAMFRFVLGWGKKSLCGDRGAIMAAATFCFVFGFVFVRFEAGERCHSGCRLPSCLI